VLAELNRFFANELGINAIVRRPSLTRVAMPVLFASRLASGFPNWGVVNGGLSQLGCFAGNTSYG
jgi:hypothetical protein